METSELMRKVIPSKLTNDDVVFVCIGTDRSTGDSLAPFVGTYLKGFGYENVYGTLYEPVHALNLVETIAILPKDKIVIAIDACLGEHASIGKVKIEKGAIKAGAGVGKNLPPVGDYKIYGVVNVGGFMEYFVLQNTKLSVVLPMANEITEAIQHVFPLEAIKPKRRWRRSS